MEANRGGTHRAHGTRGAHSRSLRLALVLLVALALAPPAAQAQEDLAAARSFAAEERYDAALEALDRHLQARPDHVEARLFQGVIFTRQSRYEDAIALFRRLADDHPDLPEPLNNLAVLYAAQSRYEEARESLIAAIELQPRYDTAHENLGDVYAKLASLAYARAHELNLRNARAQRKQRILDDMIRAREVPVARAPADEAPARDAGAGRAPADAESPAAAAPAPAAEVASALPARCYRIGRFADASRAAGAARWLAARGVAAETDRGGQREVGGHRVYLPPLASREAARAEMRRMREKGIQDVLVIGEGAQRNGISVGVFSSMAAVERRTRQLAALGWEVSHEPRRAASAVRWLETAPTAGLETDALRAAFPGVSVEPVDCGAG